VQSKQTESISELPDFKLQLTGGEAVRRSDFLGRRLLLYFYPKDNTAGCSTEAQGFRDASAQLAELNTTVIGISRDSLASHEKFRSKLELPFALACDSDESLCHLFDVMKPKKLYGRSYIGIERSTFLIDKHGIIKHSWRKVRVKNHVEEVLAVIRELQANPQDRESHDNPSSCL